MVRGGPGQELWWKQEPGPRQYDVRMDGSRNVSIRNEKFLRSFTEVADMMAEDDVSSSPVQFHSNIRMMRIVRLLT